MRWESEKWRKLYRRVDPTWLRLRVIARGVGSELLKYASDDGRVGVLAEEDTGEAVCRIMSAHRSEQKIIREIVADLLKDGYLVREPDAILIRNFEKAQARSSNAERQARYRTRHEEKRDNSDDFAADDGAETGEDDVTERVTSNASRNGDSNASCNASVTERSDGSRSISISSSISSSEDLKARKEVPVTAGAREGDKQADLFGEPSEPGKRPRAKRAPKPPTPPSPVTEVRDVWRAEWEAAKMPGPAPWGAAEASAVKTYLETPGATVGTARAAFVGMLRTPAGDWHRTHEGGRHATAVAALAGARTVEFTGAGAKRLVEQSRPPREIPPPDPIPQIFIDVAERAAAKGLDPLAGLAAKRAAFLAQKAQESGEK